MFDLFLRLQSIKSLGNPALHYKIEFFDLNWYTATKVVDL